ncbi:HAD family hydrolase [Dongia sp.]|uniref:HAD family hydrolase n=1 Tax=Dongia sp. TaxID=1977262 RepID=UPI0035B12366
MARFDLIIFDCDGVLIDSEMLACNAVLGQLRRHGIAMDLADVMGRFLGRGADELARHYEAALQTPMPDRFLTDLRRDMRVAFEGNLVAMPYVATLLQRIAADYCLASSSDLERIKFSLQLAGLYSYFEGRIFTSGMVARAKPAPDLFLLAAREMRCDPARCLVIEDSVSGINAGKAASMQVWGFVGGSHYAGRDGAAQLGAAGADRVFAHMADIERALGQESVAG